MRRGIIPWVALLAVVPIAAAQQMPTASATAPATTAAATSQSAPAFHTHFDGGDPISLYFQALSMRFGVAIVQPDALKAFIVKPFDLPAKLDDAVALGREALAPQSLTLRQSVSGNIIVLRVMSIAEARQADLQESPVSSGVELEKIDISNPDRLVTHLLPVSHSENAESLQRLAQQTKDVKADVAGSAQTGITLILTGPAKAVQDSAESVLKADTPDTTKIVARTLQLHNLNAEDLAASLNGSFALQNSGLKATADGRTNSIVVTGPEDKVIDAMVQVVGMEVSHSRIPRSLPAPQSRPAR